MPFQKHGFLGREAAENALTVRKRYFELFRLVDEVNEYVHKVVAEIKFDPYDMHQSLIGSLFAKMLHSFQAVIILTQYGLESDSNIILRALFDAVFLFGSIVEDRKFAEKYVEYQTKASQLRKVNAAINNANDLKFDDEMVKRLTDRKEELKNELGIDYGENRDKEKATLANMFSSEQLARKAGLNAMYQSGYRILSDDVHTSPFSVEAFLNIDENDERIKSIRLGPRYEAINKNCSVAMSIILQALRGVCNLTGIDNDGEITTLQKKVANFSGK
jgi:hypothetical protein